MKEGGQGRAWRRRVAVSAAVGLVAALLSAASGSVTPASAAVGGPVILGGDDLTAHGSFNTTTNVNVDGWLYIQKALQNIKPNVTRANDNSVAALGSAASTSNSGNAGGAIGRAAAAAGLTVTYYNGATAINQFFTDLRAGTAKPAIVWISGSDASNDLGDSSGAEAAALANNATTIADFVNSGGGLMSHGTQFGWLTGLLPGASSKASGDSGDLFLTAEGMAAFPGLSNTEVNAGPWHNHFEGNLGGLAVLVRSNDVLDATGAKAPVIIGGAAVQLPGSITLDPPTATRALGATHTVTATVRGLNGALAANTVVTFAVTSGPNAGRTGTGTTDANGAATFTYTGSGGAGTDAISASFTDTAGTVRTATASVVWSTTATTATTAPTATTTTLTPSGSSIRICNAGDGGSGGAGIGSGGSATSAGGTATGGAGVGTGGVGGAGGDACNVIVAAQVTTTTAPGVTTTTTAVVTTTTTPVVTTTTTPSVTPLARTGSDPRPVTTLALGILALGLLALAGSSQFRRVVIPVAGRPASARRPTRSADAGGPLDAAALDALSEMEERDG